MKAVNYRTDPIWYRLDIGPTADAGITRTKDFTDAFAGDQVRTFFAAIQELNKKIEMQDRVIAKLQKKISELESRINK